VDKYLFAALAAWAAVAVGIIGSVVSGSLVVLGDAVHGAIDAAAISIAVLVHRALKRQDPMYTYGFHRAETLATLTNSITLVLGSAYIASKAVNKLFSGARVDPGTMALSSLAILVLNLVAVMALHRGETTNLRAAYLHALSDLAMTIVALIGAAAIALTGLHVIDPAAAVAVSIYLAWYGIKMFRTAIVAALDKSPVDVESIKAELGLPVHDFHIWSLCPELRVASLHVEVDDPNTPVSKLEELRRYIVERLSRYGIRHVTIQFESGRCDVDHDHENEHVH